MARKSPARKKKSSREYDDVPETGDVVAVEEDVDAGFDADLDVDEPPTKKPARKRTTRRTAKKDEPASETSADDGDRDETEARQSKTGNSRNGHSGDESDSRESDSQDGKAPLDQDTAEASAGNGQQPSGSSSDTGDEGEGRGRKRRRRRRRRGGRGDDGAQSSQSAQSSRGGGQRGQGGGQGGQGGRQDRSGSRRSQSSGGGSNGDEITGTYEGVLELHPKNYGFLRDAAKDYMSQDSDPFVSSALIDKYGLREGVTIKGDVGPGSRNQGPRLKGVDTIDGRTPEEYASIKVFDDLTPINPFEQIQLERGERPITMRVLDLLTPIGKGQRALIVAPPRSGKTMLMQDIAESISQNHPEIHLVVLLIDERPEEVTEMRRMVKGEVIASSMDRDVESHVRVSQLLVERSKRLAEAGEHVVILLDSITRLGRAFNKWVGNSGRTGSGGLDVRALDIPRKMFGTARRFDEGGSVTVIGTALVETGSRADDAIFLEFKGTGNMELVLSRELSDRRIYPAMDIEKSGTRREEKLLDPETLTGVTMLRRSLVSLTSVDAMEQLIRTLERFPSNKDFLERVKNVL